LKISTHKPEYYILVVVQKLVSILPRRLTLLLGSFAGVLLTLFKPFKKTIYGNLRYCEYWSDDQIDTIVPNLYKMMGRYICDFLRTGDTKIPYRVHNFEKFQNAVDEKNGVIAILAHIGNWEILAQIYGKTVDELNVIAKPMKNQYVDKWLAGKREATGVTTIYTQQALRKMMDVLGKKKGVVAILIDQHAGAHGTMVPFLGKNANTVRTVAGIVKKTNCAVVPTYSIMQPDGSYDIYIDRIQNPDITGLSDDQAIEMLQMQHNDIISQWIRTYPEHYFGWFHKRYRNIIRYE